MENPFENNVTYIEYYERVLKTLLELFFKPPTGY